jgi:hypothetical protein
MSEQFIIIAKVLPVILLIIVGHFLHSFRIIKPGTVDDVKKLVVNLALPALLFMAFADTSFETRYLLIFIAVFLTCLVMLAAASLLRKPLGISNRYWPTLYSGFETGMMGYSIFVAVYGAANINKIAIMDLGQVTFVFFVLASVLKRTNGETASAKELAVSFVKSPVILSIILGILAGLTGLLSIVKGNPAGDAVIEAFGLLGGLTMPLICLVIGYELRIDLRNLARPFLTALSRIIVLAGIAFVINRLLIGGLLGLDVTYQIALYTLFILPPPFVIPIFMSSGNDDKQLVLNTISIHIILSLLAFMALIVLVK